MRWQTLGILKFHLILCAIYKNVVKNCSNNGHFHS
uniref:Uncharacterized protein n=1 Tax=Anguilla anguilla TaxID=7936 RepID=A0A0E9PQ54_ANGAN